VSPDEGQVALRKKAKNIYFDRTEVSIKEYNIIINFNNKEKTMKTRLLVALIILSVALVLPHSAVAADPVKEAKDAYAQFVKAAKTNNVEAARKLLTKDALSDLDKDNMLDFFMAMHSEITPQTIAASKAEVKGPMVVLKIEQVEKSKEGTSTSKTTVYMMKEGGKWKVGKPEGAK
jgi:hypothetical protein